MNREEAGKAALVISIDLEMFWGVHDLWSVDQRKEALLQVRPTVSRILDLFTEYEIHSTWAAVGFLFYATHEELMNNLPAIQPEYSNPGFSPYPKLNVIGPNEIQDPCHYGASLIEAIHRTPNQEIATHTFSHYYCLEAGQSKAAFQSDLKAAVRAAASWGEEVRSLVFPRNQVNSSYLECLAQCGIQSYRGAGSHWIYRERPRSEESKFRRAVRLLDAYLNLSGHHTYRLERIYQNPPFDFPASRLLRGYTPALRPLEPLRLRRICSGLDYAARKRETYHLWFHPEELAVHREKNLTALRTVVERFARLRDRGTMESLSMSELSARVLSRRAVPAGSAMTAVRRGEE
jgi:peptidoglycan/xylan/chitin deacetylase (PgdA/CDA1 family)